MTTAQRLNYVEVSASGSWTTARILRPRLMGEQVIHGTRDELLPLAEAHPRLAIDLGAIHYMGDSVLGMLITLQRQAWLARRHLLLFGLQPIILELFQICKLDRFFDIRRVAPGTPVPHLTPQEEAFVQDVRENPADPAPRLVYADWLDEHGDGDRAEFIRLQCGRGTSKEREGDLLKAHEARWAAPLVIFATRWEFAGGFVEQVELSGQALVDHASDLLRLAPVQRVRVHSQAWLDQLTRLPELDLLAEVDLTRALVDDADLNGLLAATPPRKVVLRLPGSRLRPEMRDRLHAHLGDRLVLVTPP
jgi:anti-anti-sigma factor